MPISLAPGVIIDNRYLLGALLGEGGMGCVYRATESELDRTVAIKFLQEDIIGDEVTRARFWREGKLLSGLEHPNIIKCYRYGIWQNTPYIAMECLEGESLRDYCSNRSLPVAEALSISVSVCDAMSVAHNANIIHRDLSPSNIFLQSNSAGGVIVKVIDFGLSTYDIEKSQKITQTGHLVGSVYYLSPELCAGGRPSRASDVYSLGCILYQLLTGNPPFDAPNPLALMRLHYEAAPKPLGAHLPPEHLPDGLDYVVLRSIAKLPSERYGTMDEFRKDIELVRAGAGASIAKFEANKPTGNQIRVRVLVLLALGVVAVSVTTMYLKHSYQNQRSVLPALDSRTATTMRRLRPLVELESMSKFERIQYLNSWINDYGVVPTLDAVIAHLYLSHEYLDDPVVCNKLSDKALEISHKVFAESLTRNDGNSVMEAVHHIGMLWDERNEPDLRARDFLSMTQQIKAKGEKGFYNALNTCRRDLIAYYLGVGQSEVALQLSDECLSSANRCSMMAAEKFIFMLHRSICLWRLNRVGAATAQLRESYDFCRRLLPGNIDTRLKLAGACFEEEQYLLCVKVGQMLESIVMESAEHPTNKLALLESYKLTFAACEKMARYGDAFDVLVRHWRATPDLNTRLALWRRAGHLSIVNRLGKERELRDLMDSELSSISISLSEKDIDSIFLSVAELSNLSCSREDFATVKTMVQLGDDLLRKFNPDLSQQTPFGFTTTMAGARQRLKDLAQAERILLGLIDRLKNSDGDHGVLILQASYQLCNVYSDWEQPQKVLKCINTMGQIKVAEKKHPKLIVGRYFVKAVALRTLKRFDESELAVREGMEVGEHLKMHEVGTEGLLLLGANEYDKNDLQSAETFLLQCVSRSVFDSRSVQMRALGWLAKVYITRQKHSEAENTMERIRKLALQSDPSRRYGGYNILLGLYKMTGNKPEAAALTREVEELKASLLPR